MDSGGDNSWFVQQLGKLAESIGYQETTHTFQARERLGQVLEQKAVNLTYPSDDRQVIEVLEAYNEEPEFASHSADTPQQGTVIWVGSRLLLAGTYLQFDRYSEAADAMEDAILRIEAQPENNFDSKRLDTFKQIKADLRDWAGIPGLI